ncbi:PTS system transporter subunit IIA [Klebsiella michiganensis]|nr:PTS system transporter subunit IIA [Klebsiella michiganensis]
MLGWVITCHDELAQEMLDRLEKKFGPLTQCRAVNYWRNSQQQYAEPHDVRRAARDGRRRRGHFSDR